MALTFDLSGLPLLESEIAALVAAQSATPAIFTGGATFTATFKNQPAPGSGAMTTAALIARLQALLLVAQSLPQ
jgi:hypothetical protein